MSRRVLLFAAVATGLLLSLSALGCGGPSASPPAEPEPSAVLSPVPEPEMPHGFVEAILNDAAERTGQPADALRVERADPTTFTDTALGCPPDAAGGTPMAAQIEGYTVIVLLEDDTSGLQQRLDYRIRSDDGSFIVCDTVPPDQLP